MMPLPEFHCRITKELGYPVMTHEMGAKAWWAQVKEVYRDRFVALCATGAAPDA